MDECTFVDNSVSFDFPALDIFFSVFYFPLVFPEYDWSDEFSGLRRSSVVLGGFVYRF